MGIRIAFSDMDDTLLNRKKQVTPYTLEVLSHLAEHGVEFVPCSGRPLTGIPRELLALDAVNYVVTSNGAAIVDIRGAEPKNIYQCLIRTSSILALYEELADLDILFDVFLDGRAYAERFRYDHLEEFDLSSEQVEAFRTMRTQVDVTIPELLEGHTHVDKALLMWKDPHDRDRIVEHIEQNPELEWASSHPINIEVGRVGVTKGSGLLWLCEHLGIDIADSVAFGDNINDIPMIDAAGDGVAMANAVEPVLLIANHVTLDCDEDGVAHYLEQILQM